MTEIVNEAWIRALVTSMQPTERAREVTEVLSDASSEQYLNALTALSLRGFWRGRGKTSFWVRSEWAKTDISYGQATKRFDYWNAAWKAGESGDLGQIEAKVIYSHHGPRGREHKLSKLKRQLKRRWEFDQEKLGPQAPLQRYHGLVWLYHHGQDDERSDRQQIRKAQDSIRQHAKDEGLCSAFRGALFRDVVSAPLGDLWPNGPRDYVGRLSLAVLTLPT